jgi:hypothetical protein
MSLLHEDQLLGYNAVQSLKLKRRFGGIYRLHLQIKEYSEQESEVREGGKYSSERENDVLLSTPSLISFPFIVCMNDEVGGSLLN